MLNEIKEMKRIIIEAIALADWVFETQELPASKKNEDVDYFNDEIESQVKKSKVLVKAGIDLAHWGKTEYVAIDNSGKETVKRVTTLTVSFNKCTKTLTKLINMDLDGKLLSTKDQYLGQINGEDVYVKPWELMYECGWFGFTVIIDRD
jgi:hypothetical protein